MFFPEDFDEAPFPDGASTVAVSDQVPPSDTSTALDQWDLVTHTFGDAQDKNEKLANVVYNEIKGQKRIRHNVDVCYMLLLLFQNCIWQSCDLMLNVVPGRSWWSQAVSSSDVS